MKKDLTLIVPSGVWNIKPVLLESFKLALFMQKLSLLPSTIM